MMGQSKFEGSVIIYIAYVLLFLILVPLTFGILYPWIAASFQRWICENTVIDGRRLSFDGSGTQLFGNYIKWLLFTFLTCGIYGFWLFNKMTSWRVKHTHFADGL